MLCLIVMMPGCRAQQPSHTPYPEQLPVEDRILPGEKAYHLRVLTYNVNYCRGMDGRVDYQRIADIIKRSKPDLVALQELYRAKDHPEGINQGERLAELTGMHMSFMEPRPDFAANDYSNAVLSRYPFVRHTAWDLSGKDHDGKRISLSLGEVSPWPDNWSTIPFGSIRLGEYSKTEGLPDGLRYLLAFNCRFSPNILAGTLNFYPDDPAAERLRVQDRWIDAALYAGNEQATYPADKPKQRIDYVFFREARYTRVVESRVLNEPVASDHRPLLVVLEYTPPSVMYPPATDETR